MGAKEHSASTTSRLTREDCRRTKHDSLFSNWVILVGPSDWENYSLGKEGTERYRIHNIPIGSSRPGLYELGIGISTTNLGRNVRKLDPNHVICVYLGQADNVRTRLQHYGRAGSHLERGNSIGDPNENKSSRCGLFREIFSRGFSIVFRWVPMDNKKDAENTEAELLRYFDYAWNKGGNGARRPDDVLVKLNKVSSIASWLWHWKWDDLLNLKKEGIRIKASKPETKSSTCTDQGSDNHFAQIIKFGRSRPQLISVRRVENSDSETICGVALHDGSVCRRKPVKGRKRCEDHRGKRINVSMPNLVAGEKSNGHNLGLESPYFNDQECDDRRLQMSSYGKLPYLARDEHIANEDVTVCGVALGDGSVCGRRPVEGRKRCAEHKGRRTNGSAPSLMKGGECYVPNLVAGEKSNVRDLGVESPFLNHQECHGFRSQMSNYGKLPYLARDEHVANEDLTICGVALGDGSVCRRWPVEGRKRCAEHKGRRMNVSTPSLVKGGKCYMPQIHSDFNPHSDWACDDNRSSSFTPYGSRPQLGFDAICGAATVDGSVCRRPPADGRKRCWQHKGRRAY